MIVTMIFEEKQMFFEKENENIETSNNPFEVKEEIGEEVKEEVQEEIKDENEQEIQEENEVSEENTQVEGLKAELADLNNKYLRLAADFDNYRKRQAQERESLLKYGAAETMTKLLVVLDTFERAKEQLKEIEDCKSVKDGYEVVFKQLVDVLKKAGLEKIEAQGAEFDPNLHEAVAKTPTTEYPDNTVILEMQAGYKLGDRVLRPALVNVAQNEE